MSAHVRACPSPCAPLFRLYPAIFRDDTTAAAGHLNSFAGQHTRSGYWVRILGCVCVCTQVPPVRARSAHLIRDGPAPWQPLSACHVYRHRRSAAARGHVYRHSFLGPHHSIRDAAAQPHQRRAATHAAPVAYWSYGSRTWYISPIRRAATQAAPRRRHQQERAGLGLGIPATLRHTCPDATLAIRHLHPPPPPHPPRGIYLTCVCAAGAAHRRKLIRGLNTNYGSAR